MATIKQWAHVQSTILNYKEISNRMTSNQIQSLLNIKLINLPVLIIREWRLRSILGSLKSNHTLLEAKLKRIRIKMHVPQNRLTLHTSMSSISTMVAKKSKPKYTSRNHSWMTSPLKCKNKKQSKSSPSKTAQSI